MESVKELQKNTAVIESKSHSIRAILKDGETLFAARDILQACGIKYPGRWMNRVRHEFPNKYPEEKLTYPFMTDGGLRGIKMIFVSENTAMKILEATPCTQEMKKWLIKDVLTYKIDTDAHCRPGTAHEGLVIEEKEQCANHSAEELNRMIDRILIVLLEMKKAVTIQ